MIQRGARQVDRGRRPKWRPLDRFEMTTLLYVRVLLYVRAVRSELRTEQADGAVFLQNGTKHAAR